MVVVTTDFIRYQEVFGRCVVGQFEGNVGPWFLRMLGAKAEGED